MLFTFYFPEICVIDDFFKKRIVKALKSSDYGRAI